MKKIVLALIGLVLIASLVSSACAAGTTTSIRVKAYEMKNNKAVPVTFASIYLDGNYKAKTDANGQCYIHYVTPGKHRLVASKGGTWQGYCGTLYVTVPTYRAGYIPAYSIIGKWSISPCVV